MLDSLVRLKLWALIQLANNLLSSTVHLIEAYPEMPHEIAPLVSSADAYSNPHGDVTLKLTIMERYKDTDGRVKPWLKYYVPVEPGFSDEPTWKTVRFLKEECPIGLGG